MKFDKIYNKGQAQLFKNQYLEYLTKTHPLVIWGMYIPVITGLLYFSAAHAALSGVQITLAFFSGMFFWTLFEYIMHRFVFLMIASCDRARKIVYVLHGNDHEYPRD